jgi:NTP pyrophosphatase (non-canonical NTP hydrolase)
VDATKLPEDWINQVDEWRTTKMENAPRPFTTPPLFDSAFYLFTEIVELAGAIHKLYTPDHLRNPESLRGGISDELGDCFLMLATVCKHINVDGFVTDHRPEPQVIEGTPNWYWRPQILIATSLEITATSEWINTFGLCRKLYRHLLALAWEYRINPWDALRGSMAKMEERAGL